MAIVLLPSPPHSRFLFCSAGPPAYDHREYPECIFTEYVLWYFFYESLIHAYVSHLFPHLYRRPLSFALPWQIRDSASRPLDGDCWWKDADSPWQFLAVCADLVAALDSPDPTKYLSCLPVHQDGED